MSDVGKRIKEAREKLSMTQEELAHRLGYRSKSTVNKVEMGINDLTPSKLEAYAKVLGTTPSFLMGWTVTPYIPMDNIGEVAVRRFHVLGEIACGEPRLMSEEVELYVDVKTDIKADFILYAKGDSMSGARINDGDIVFIRRQPTVENGEIAAVAINDEATLKRCFYYPDKEMLILRPANDKYEEMVFVGEELRQVRILGKAVAFQSDVK